MSDFSRCLSWPFYRFSGRPGGDRMQAASAGYAVCCALLGAVVGMGGEMAQAQAKATQSPAQNAVLTLDHGWQFRQIMSGAEQGEHRWVPATVPGDVHLDLLANKKITDPFYRDNEAKLQWIENESWEYQLSFEVMPAMLARAHVDLVFDGLDGAAEVSVNGVKLLSTDNSFRIWRVPAKSHLHAGKNLLSIVFPSPIKAAAAVAAGDPWQPKTKVEPKTYIRKPAYEYGWDWGPRFVTSGIWKPVRLEAWDKVRIADFAIRQRDVSREVAHLDAEVEIEAARAGTATVSVQYSGDGKPGAHASTVYVHAGRNVIDLPIQILQPKLWYPAGYGEQPLYEFTAQVDRKSTRLNSSHANISYA